MKEREDFDAILASTLSCCWSNQFGTTVRVRSGRIAGEQHWHEQTLFSAYCVGPVGRRARRFLRDSIRFTPVRARLPVQFVAGTLLATRVGLRLARRQGFSVHPALTRAEQLLVLPGNQRIRVFDFASNVARVQLKSGFAARTLANEVALRASASSRAIPGIVRSDVDTGWFEEQIIDGWALPRLPSWRSRERAEHTAFEELDRWIEQTTEPTDLGRHGEQLVVSIRASQEQLRAAGLVCELPDRWAEALLRAAQLLGRGPIALTHGDFQPGNVLVERSSDRVWITDWEHGARRFAHYDRMVWGLRSRGGAGLAARFRAFIDGADDPATAPLPRDRRWRRAAIGLFVLEDLAWFISEATSGPYRRLPRGLTGYLEELPRLVELVA